MKKLIIAVSLMAASVSTFAGIIHFPFNHNELKEVLISEDYNQLMVMFKSGGSDRYLFRSVATDQLNVDGYEYSFMEFVGDNGYTIDLQIYDKLHMVCLYQFATKKQLFRQCIDSDHLWIEH